MRTLADILNEKEEKKVQVFVSDDPNVEFPNDTMATLKKTINKGAKNLDSDWKNAIQLVDASFDELEIPRPMAYSKKRWEQYNKLISGAVRDLHDARGSEE